MKRLLYLIVACFTLYSCGNIDAEKTTSLKVNVTAGEAFETELTFTVTSDNAESCAWICVEKGAALPSGIDIMQKGKAVFANTDASCKAQNLKDGVTYAIIAAAMSGDDIITSDPVEMTTIKKPVQPAVNLSSGFVNASSYSFTLTPQEAEECAYKVYPYEGTATADDVLNTGVKVSATEESQYTVEDLEDGVYFVVAAVRNGDKTVLSNKLMFTINTALPEYTITVQSVKINPDLETNGRDWIVRFYFYDNVGEYSNIALNFVTPDNGHSYVPEGSYVLGAESGNKLDPEYTYHNHYSAYFESGYCNVSIKDKQYTFDIRLTRCDDGYDFSGEVFVLKWTGTVEHMPIL